MPLERRKTKEGIREFKRAINLKKKAMMQGVSQKMRGVMMYTFRTVQNSFRPLPKKQIRGEALYLYDFSGRKICTMEEFLKGAYRAINAGSFKKEKVQTRVKGSFPPGTYAQKNEQPGTFFTKKTGKFSEEERANIKDSRDPQASQRRILREIRRRERRLSDMGVDSPARKTWSETEFAQVQQLKKEVRQLKKRKNSSTVRAHKYRIVQQVKGDVAARDVQTHRMYPQRSRPGEPPRTRSSRDAKGNKRLSLRSGIFFESTKDKTGFTIYAVALSSGNLIFRNLEYGGTGIIHQGKGELQGYCIVSERSSVQHKNGRVQEFSHRRISLGRVTDQKQKKKIRFRARPFFEPAKERAIQKIQEIFGNEGTELAKNAKLF